MDQVKQRIVKLCRYGDQEVSGVGVISSGRVFTSAGHFEHFKVGPFGFVSMNAERVATGHKCRLDSVLNTSWGLMVLDEDSLEVKSDDPEGDVYEVLHSIEDEEARPPMHPCRIALDKSRSHWFDGYFFLQDGVATKTVQFKIEQDDLFIYADIESDLDVTGCAGGPLMTADHKFIGIIVGVIEGGTRQIRALRLDQALPEYLAKSVTWGELSNRNHLPIGEALIDCLDCGEKVREEFVQPCAACGKWVCVDCQMRGDGEDEYYCDHCGPQVSPGSFMEECPSCGKKGCEECFSIEIEEAKAKIVNELVKE